MKLLPAALVLVALFSLSNCATIISGSQQKIPVVSNVPGAEVWVNGDYKDTTPCIVKVQRSYKVDQKLEIKKQGYKTETLILNRKFNEISTLNFLFWWNWVIDGATRSVIKYERPDTIILVPKIKKSN